MNYRKLFKDKAEGKIDNDMLLVMDNDGGYWQCTNEEYSEELKLIKQDTYEERYGTPEGYRDIVDVLNAAGINADWC